MICRQDRHTIAAADAEHRFQRTRGRRNSLREGGIGQRGTAIAQRRLVRREGGVARDKVGEIHGAEPRPLLPVYWLTL